jgi:DNA-binding PadR family transcriptional regulator
LVRNLTQWKVMTTINATAASLLGLLHVRNMSGWDLVEAAQERIGNYWTLTQSQVYRELAKMDERNLVALVDVGARDRKVYQITAAGRETFREWINRDPAADQIRVPLLLTIQFSEHLDPGRLTEILAAQRAAHAERLAKYERNEEVLEFEDRVHGPRNVLRRATLRFGIRHEQAALAWFDELPELLSGTIPPL